MDVDQMDRVVCTNCGNPQTFARGTLTEAGKQNFVCSQCSKSTVEGKVEAHRMKGRQLLTED